MSQVFPNKESIGVLSKTAALTFDLSASVITIGARQYTTGVLSCDLAVSGVGGLDTGAVAANSVYYIYAVVDSGSVVLIASLDPVNPLGYTLFKKLGAANTNGVPEIISVNSIGADGRFNKMLSRQIFTSGSGTYTTPAGVDYIRVLMSAGGGGGGGESGGGGGGGTSTFGTSLLTCTGGGAGQGAQNQADGGYGGTATANTPLAYALHGNGGGAGMQPSGVPTAIGGVGGGSPLFGGGAAGVAGNISGPSGINYGAGGAGDANQGTGAGGCAGGGSGSCIDAVIHNPDASYSYVVGAAGSAGAGGGGAGVAGIIIVEEYY